MKNKTTGKKPRRPKNRSKTNDLLDLHTELAALRRMLIDLSRTVNESRKDIRGKVSNDTFVDELREQDRKVALVANQLSRLDVRIDKRQANETTALEAMVRGAIVALDHSKIVQLAVIKSIDKELLAEKIAATVLDWDIKEHLPSMEAIKEYIRQGVLKKTEDILASFRVIVMGLGEPIAITRQLAGSEIKELDEEVSIPPEHRPAAK